MRSFVISSVVVVMMLSGYLDLAPGSSVRATAAPIWTKPEEYVLAQVRRGEPADLEDHFPPTKFKGESRTLSGKFLKELLTNPPRSASGRSYGVRINGALIQDSKPIDLHDQTVQCSVTLTRCRFDAEINFDQCSFERGLNFERCEFNRPVDFQHARIAYDFSCLGSIFNAEPSDHEPEAEFIGANVGGNFLITGATFNEPVNFTQMKIGGDLEARKDDNTGQITTFGNKVDFNEMNVTGNAFFGGCTFRSDVDFTDSVVTNLFLTAANFDGEVKLIRMRMDTGFLDTESMPGPVKLDGMTFQSLSPLSWRQLKSLTKSSNCDAVFYSDLETLFRKHGFTDQANDVYIAERDKEREEINKWSFWGPPKWLFSFLQFWLIGYGRHLEWLLIWSLVFIGIGCGVFWKKDWMDPKKPEDKDKDYNCLWYSLDLFLPILRLGDADTWTPKDTRRVAVQYKRLHIIVGSLFVPIGLAAWTGIIK